MRIMASALELLRNRPFSQITVEQITESADVGKGTFFNHFPSKEHVLLAAILLKQQAFLDCRREFRTTTDARRTLFEFAHLMEKNPPRTPCLLRNILSTVMSNDLVNGPFRELMTLARQSMTILMKRGQELGQVRTDYSGAQLARMLQQIIFGTQAVWSMSGPADLHVWLEESLDLFWAGASAKAATGRLSKRVEKRA